ncbi:MAG: hypothetical protein P8075_20570 [Deltaproteobacteria bacterium]|jgi:hypothetical protein
MDSKYLEKRALFGVVFILSISLLTMPTLANAADTHFCAGRFLGYLRLVSGPGECRSRETEIILPGASAMQEQINSLQSRVVALESELDAANTTISSLQAALARLESAVARLDNTSLESRVAAVEANTVLDLDQVLTFNSSSGTVLFEGVNVQVINGMGTTATNNGLGNVILGYDEDDSADTKSGSHNLVVGSNHTYTSYGGIVTGLNNEISGPYASVSGGFGNVASGDSSSVSGGFVNAASGDFSSVSGGFGNEASGDSSSVSGGFARFVAGEFNWAAGGLSEGF